MSAPPDFEAFVASLRADAPPANVPTELTALWWAKRDQWDRAHDLLQDLTTVASSRVHAHLHRIEGDLDNANYWYQRAGVATVDAPLATEWELLTKDLLAQASADSALR
jgi:hypothetical protein